MDFEFDREIIFEDKKVKLESLKEQHSDHLLPITLSQPDLLKYSPSPFGSAEFLQNYISNALAQRQDRKRYAFAIFDKEKSRYAGSTSFGEISNRDRRLQIGWTWIGKDFQRTGLNRSCKFLLLTYAFEKLKFERVEFVTDSRNIQSRKAIEGIGGKFEGELRSHVLMPDGYRRNTRYYSILKDEWNDIKSSVFKDNTISLTTDIQS